MFSSLQTLVVALISYAAFAGAIWGLIDVVRAPQHAFTSGGKQSKTLWLILLVAASALLFIFLPWPLGAGGGPFNMLGLAASAVVILYFVWVRPAIAPYRGSRGGDSRKKNTGGW